MLVELADQEIELGEIDFLSAAYNLNPTFSVPQLIRVIKVGKWLIFRKLLTAALTCATFTKDKGDASCVFYRKLLFSSKCFSHQSTQNCAFQAGK